MKPTSAAVREWSQVCTSFNVSATLAVTQSTWIYFLCESSFQQSLLNRRRREIVDDCEFWLISREDLILSKVCAARYRDYSDAEEVLVIQRQLDEDYMRHWAKELGVLDKLEQLLKESQET